MIPAKKMIIVNSYNQITRAFDVSMQEMPATGPLFVAPEDLARALGLASAKTLLERSDQYIGAEFQTKTDLLMIDDYAD